MMRVRLAALLAAHRALEEAAHALAGRRIDGGQPHAVGYMRQHRQGRAAEQRERRVIGAERQP